MSIISSTYAVDSYVQSDGRVYVVERHTDADGSVYSTQYLAGGAVDYASIAAARAAQINEALAAVEAGKIIND